MSAVVGAGTSDISMEIAKTLAPQKIPQISYAASTMELADKSLYPYFLRTVGSDTKQVRAMLDIIRFYEWTYVKLLYSDTVYGTAAAKEFLRLAPELGVCVATQVQLSPYLTRTAGAMSNIVSYYLTEAFTEAKVVVMFTTDHDTRAVLEAMRNVLGNHSSDIVWLASDFWGSREVIHRDLELQAGGALTLEFLSHHISGFMQHFRSLHPTVNNRNPWFGEFWQRRFKCFTSNSLSRRHNQPCSPGISLINEYLRMATDVPYVIDAVYTVALSLHKLLLDHCGNNSTGLCPAAQKALPHLYDYMKNVQFYNSITNLTVAYDALGNGLARYRLLNLQGQEGAFDYRPVRLIVAKWRHLAISNWVHIGPGNGLLSDDTKPFSEPIAFPDTHPGHISLEVLKIPIRKINFEIHFKLRPDSKYHGANMGPTWVLSAPDGPHVGPMNLAIRASKSLRGQRVKPSGVKVLGIIASCLVRT